MKKALMIEDADIKTILAEKYNVPEKNVVKNKYSYTVVLESEEESEVSIDEHISKRIKSH